MTFADFEFPPEWQGFGFSCLDLKRRRPVMVLVEMCEQGKLIVVGEVEFPSDSHGWTGKKPLTRAAREMLVERP